MATEEETEWVRVKEGREEVGEKWKTETEKMRVGTRGGRIVAKTRRGREGEQRGNDSPNVSA